MKAAAKSQKPRARPRTEQKPKAAPFGLMLLFSMMRQPHSTQVASTMDAARSFPLAMRLIELAHAPGEEQLTPFLMESVEAMFGKLIEPEDAAEPSHVADASFRIGMATAWVLMQGLQSGSAVSLRGGTR